MKKTCLFVVVTYIYLIWIAGCAPQGISVSTLAGSGKTGPLGGGYADGPANQAQFHDPIGITIDQYGNLYVSDWVNHRIRKITPQGEVSTLAGGGEAGPKGDLADGPGSAARFWGPEGIAVDSQGNVFVADTLNNRIRRISPDGVVSTVAGSGPGTRFGYDGALVDGPADVARFNDPSDVVVDSKGALFVTDRLNHVIRKITPDGYVSTFAGNGQSGGADGVGKMASLELPNRIAIDKEDNLYITEGRGLDLGEYTYGFSVRKITPDGRVTTLAGTGEPGYRDGPALSAQFVLPIGIAVDEQGIVYVVDSSGNRIRRISKDGMVSTVAGNGQEGYRDGNADQAEFFTPRDIAISQDGTLFIADWKNYRIRRITGIE
jgi:serine/threonine-protein kinase